MLAGMGECGKIVQGVSVIFTAAETSLKVVELSMNDASLVFYKLLPSEVVFNGPGIESRWGGARFSASIQAGPGAHPVYYTMGTRPLSRE
jgi:hypothetical protein